MGWRGGWPWCVRAAGVLALVGAFGAAARGAEPSLSAEELARIEAQAGTATAQACRSVEAATRAGGLSIALPPAGGGLADGPQDDRAVAAHLTGGRVAWLLGDWNSDERGRAGPFERAVTRDLGSLRAVVARRMAGGSERGVWTDAWLWSVLVFEPQAGTLLVRIECPGAKARPPTLSAVHARVQVTCGAGRPGAVSVDFEPRTLATCEGWRESRKAGAQALTRLAVQQAEAGDAHAAAALFERATRLGTSDAALRLEVALGLMGAREALGDPSGARGALEALWKVEGDTVSARLLGHLGRLAVRTGDRGLALRAYRHALEAWRSGPAYAGDVLEALAALSPRPAAAGTARDVVAAAGLDARLLGWWAEPRAIARVMPSRRELARLADEQQLDVAQLTPDVYGSRYDGDVFELAREGAGVRVRAWHRAEAASAPFQFVRYEVYDLRVVAGGLTGALWTPFPDRGRRFTLRFAGGAPSLLRRDQLETPEVGVPAPRGTIRLAPVTDAQRAAFEHLPGH